MSRKCECINEEDRRENCNYARYYDTPDGCDIATKAMVASRYGIVTGLVLSTYDVLMYSHAVGMTKILQRYIYHTVPFALMGATFAVVSNAALNARNKDDHLNYFLGGFACGPILASYLGTKHAILLGGLALGAIAMIKKDAILNNYRLVPDIVPHMGTISSWRNDYTLVHDPKDTPKYKCNECRPKVTKCDTP